MEMTKSENIAADLDRVRALHEAAKYDEAYKIARQCVTDATILCDQPLKFRAMTAMGHVLRAKRDFEGALNVLAGALNLAKLMGDAELIAKTWNNLGLLFQDGSAWDLALECYYRVTTSESLSRTAACYSSHGNAAICALHKDELRQALPEVRQALRIETSALKQSNPYNSTLLRYVFVQIGLRSNRVPFDQIKLMSMECQSLSISHPSPRIQILTNLTEGSLEVAYGDRKVGIRKLEAALAKAQSAKELITDALSCLIQAEMLAGNAGKAQEHLTHWIQEANLSVGWLAEKHLGIPNLWQIGRELESQLQQLSLHGQSARICNGQKPSLPPGIRSALKDWIYTQYAK